MDPVEVGPELEAPLEGVSRGGTSIVLRFHGPRPSDGQWAITATMNGVRFKTFGFDTEATARRAWAGAGQLIQKLVEAEWAKHLYQVSGPDPWEDR